MSTSGGSGREKPSTDHSQLGPTAEVIRQHHASTQRPVVLRFEAEGDARFSSSLLQQLTDARIPFSAQVHHYEGETHANSTAAKERLSGFGEHVTQRFGMDVTRKTGTVKATSPDFTFIRNLVGTDEATKTTSNTKFKDVQNLHRDAMRQRRNSISEGGELIVGGSGAPFIKRDKDNKSKIESTDNLQLGSFGSTTLGMQSSGSLQDKVGVMKDDGRTLSGGRGEKVTHSMRFKKPVSTPQQPEPATSSPKKPFPVITPSAEKAPAKQAVPTQPTSPGLQPPVPTTPSGGSSSGKSWADIVGSQPKQEAVQPVKSTQSATTSRPSSTTSSGTRVSSGGPMPPVQTQSKRPSTGGNGKGGKGGKYF
ncbi:MAG TPA: hypothetical protein VLC08_06210 [Chitinolyticbacter sp.]|nr:hypothetical protein [Chitinolyticbacter sp.]